MCYGYMVRCSDEARVELTEEEFKTASKAVKALRKQPDSATAKGVLELYNRICTRSPSAKKLTAKRCRAIKKALDDGYDLQKLFESVAASDFLCGQNSRNWRAGLDWILEPDNLIKIYEGQYSSRADPRQLGNSSLNVKGIMDDIMAKYR
ncbi:MAG: hypothetical protein IJZ95_07390 [Oscillospiraceae bacterium]|nr:hypothetical protein [Oscillospiraceae bacterium]